MTTNSEAAIEIGKSRRAGQREYGLVESDDQHRVVVERIEFEDGVLSELEVSVEHPARCTVGWQEEPRCALEYEITNMGPMEALGLSYYSGPRQWSFDVLAFELVRLMIITGRDEFPISYQYHAGWSGYWEREWDSALYWQPR